MWVMPPVAQQDMLKVMPEPVDDPAPRTPADGRSAVPVRFVVPRPPKHHVDRPRLSALLEQGAQAPLTLVSAPAGSGKTTLVAGWVAGGVTDPVGWVTFEGGGGPPGRLLAPGGPWLGGGG